MAAQASSGTRSCHVAIKFYQNRRGGILLLCLLIASCVFACEGEDVLVARSCQEKDVAVDCLFWWTLSRWRVTIFKTIIFCQASVNSLTAIRVLAGTKNSRPVGFYSRNSTKSTLNPNTTIPQIWPPWWCRLPLIRRGIYGSARSDAPTLFQRGRAWWWSKRII